MILKFLIEKEFKQILRNSFLPKLIIIYPCIMMLVLPWAANLEIKNINLCVVDNDYSPLSGRLAKKAASSGYFRLVGVVSSYDEAMKSVESADADIILEIPAAFERDMMKEGKAEVLISANTVNGTKGALGSSYLSGIVSDFSAEIRSEMPSGNSGAPNLKLVVQNRFNPQLDYKFYMIPALMVMLLTILCGFLPALNIVGEKEKGTIEQINVTPVGKFTFILAKLIPYWLIGFIVLSLCFVLAALVYRIVPAGSLLTIYCFSILYVLAISGFGLVISNYSETMQQAMFVMFFFMIILLLMSGLFTPVTAMPEWAQYITAINPLKYFVQVMRQVYLKGSSVSDLTSELMAICGFALFFNLWAIFSYKKST